MRKMTMLIMGLFSLFSLIACQSNTAPAGQLTIVMELDEHYDLADPFVDARLFCVSEDIDVLEAEMTFEMDGEHGLVEIKELKTGETLWSSEWDQSVDQDTWTISLKNMKKEKEYGIWFTGTKIRHAMVRASFDSPLVQEKERPSR